MFLSVGKVPVPFCGYRFVSIGWGLFHGVRMEIRLCPADLHRRDQVQKSPLRPVPVPKIMVKTGIIPQCPKLYYDYCKFASEPDGRVDRDSRGGSGPGKGEDSAIIVTHASKKNNAPEIMYYWVQSNHARHD